MPRASIRKPSSLASLQGLKRQWQRGLIVEYALVALFVAFAVAQFLLIFNTKAS